MALALVPAPSGPRALTALLSTLPTLTTASAYEGFGSTTPGGSGEAVVHVTNLNDSGPGSFRDAVSRSNRTIVFDVPGNISLTSHVYVTGAFITIDGFTAPSPGITLKGYGLYIRGNKGAHDVIVRGIRVRDSAEDGIQVAWSASNIVIDKVSIQNSLDGNLDITESAHDITVSWSILGPLPSNKNMLIGYNPARITLHHNVFVNSKGRNPYISNNYDGTPAPDTTVDMRNNIVWDWGGGFGTMVAFGAKANVMNNFYSSNGGDKSDTLIACTGGGQAECTAYYPASYAWAYVDGNFSADGISLGDFSNLEKAEPAPSVDTVEACTAAFQVLANVGVRPLDTVDQGYLSPIKLPACLGVIPGRLDFSGTVGGSNPASKTLSIAGLGGTDYVWTANATGGTWLSITPLDGPTPSEISVLTNLSGLTAGTYVGNITVTAGGAPNSPITIPVSLVVDGTGSLDPNSSPTSGSGADLLVAHFSARAQARRGWTISVSDGTKNQGEGTAGDSTTRFYLSTDTVIDSADILLGGRAVPSLAAGEKSDGSTNVTIPTNIPKGSYYLIAKADADDVVPETIETNNTTLTTVRIR